MSEQSRKEFNLDEQKAKDILAAIKTIVPVISLIRELGKVEGQLSLAEKEEKRLKEEVDAINTTLTLLSDKPISALVEEHNKKAKLLQEAIEKHQGLQRTQRAYKGEIKDYREYAKLFKWLSYHDLRAVLNNNFLEKEETLAMLLLIFYSNSSVITRGDLVWSHFESVLPNLHFGSYFLYKGGSDDMINELKKGNF